MNIAITYIKFTLVVFFLISITSFAQDSLSTTNSESVQPDTIQQGVQGSINPLSDHTQALTGTDLLDKSFPNSWPIFGTDIRMRIGGYVKADFIRDFDYIGDRWEFELGSIPVDGNPLRDLGGITTFHVKQTRINFDLRSKAKWGSGQEFPLQVFVEFDWFFDADAYRFIPRMRLAYGVIGRLLIGRSWTFSGDLASLPGLIDFAGGDALYGGRATQIRWQDNINENFVYAVGILEPGGQIANPENLEGAFRPLWPQVTAMIKWKSTDGSSVQLGADIFPLSWAGPDSVPNVSKAGYAFTATGRLVFEVTEFKDAIGWGAGIGEGQAHSIIALSWDRVASGVISESGLDLAPAWFAYIGYNHYWSESLNSTISTAWTKTTLSPLQPDHTIQSAGSFHINLIWFPYRLVSTGIEYMWGVREDKNGAQGTASRIQLMAKFKFN